MYTHIVARTRLICPLLLKEGKNTYSLPTHTVPWKKDTKHRGC